MMDVTKGGVSQTLLDKSKWPEGPWQTEPDLQAWKTQAGYPGLIARHEMMGNLCGYVFVPPGHPWHGKNYNECLACTCREGEWMECEAKTSPGAQVDVHGGLTFAGDALAPFGKRIETAPLWGFGFDCGHAFDLQPGLNALIPATLAGELLKDYASHYRDLAYVQAQCESLAAQLKAVTMDRLSDDLDWPRVEPVAALPPPSNQE